MVVSLHKSLLTRPRCLTNRDEGMPVKIVFKNGSFIRCSSDVPIVGYWTLDESVPNARDVDQDDFNSMSYDELMDM